MMHVLIVGSSCDTATVWAMAKGLKGISMIVIDDPSQRISECSNLTCDYIPLHQIVTNAAFYEQPTKEPWTAFLPRKRIKTALKPTRARKTCPVMAVPVVKIQRHNPRWGQGRWKAKT